MEDRIAGALEPVVRRLVEELTSEVREVVLAEVKRAFVEMGLLEGASAPPLSPDPRIKRPLLSADAERARDYIKRNPGCTASELNEALGLSHLAKAAAANRRLKALKKLGNSLRREGRTNSVRYYIREGR